MKIEYQPVNLLILLAILILLLSILQSILINHRPQPGVLALGVLLLLIMALLCGVLTVQPRNYAFYEFNLSEMRKELGKIDSVPPLAGAGTKLAPRM
jgi:hypothetical protein